MACPKQLEINQEHKFCYIKKRAKLLHIFIHEYANIFVVIIRIV